MRVYKINNITGAIRQIFGKKQALSGKALVVSRKVV